MAKQNVLTRSKKIKAEELFRSNRLEEARVLYAGVCQSDRSDADAWVMQGIINRKLGLFREAEECCRRALAIKPSLAPAHHALGAAVQCQGRMDEALACYYTAIQLQPDFAEAHYFLGNALSETGVLDKAVTSFRRAIEIRPVFLEALSNLGAALTMLGETEEAVSVLNRALVLRPDSPQVLCNLGRILRQNRGNNEALETYRRALLLDPNSLDAVENVAMLLEVTNHLEEAQSLLDKELPQAPDNVALNLVAAKLARRAGQLDQAVALLEKLVRQAAHSEMAPEIHHLLGQLYDRLGEPERAFPHFVEGNRLVAQGLPADRDQNSYLSRVDRISRYLTDGLAKAAIPYSGAAEEYAPVFLIGFSRSGTTLLEQILDSHRAVQTLDERSTVFEMEKAFLEMAGERENALAELTAEEIARLRQVYFDELAKHITLKPGTLLVDKLPLNTVKAHLIWRVFPHAKFILAIRHPCDVCLSCFMQHFAVNDANNSFFTLESTAQVYARVMGLWQKYVSTLPLDYHRIRYEDLVTNFEQETRALLDFLDVGWDDAVLGYTEHAKKRGAINTPSYHQVTQPIYQHAKYRWKRYAKEFDPVMETLNPFIEYFGYGEKQG